MNKRWYPEVGWGPGCASSPPTPPPALGDDPQCSSAPKKYSQEVKWPESSHLLLTLLVGAQLHALCQGSMPAVGKMETALIRLGRTVRAAIYCGLALGQCKERRPRPFQRMSCRWEPPSCSQACGPDWLCHRSWLPASLGCPRASPDRTEVDAAAMLPGRDCVHTQSTLSLVLDIT